METTVPIEVRSFACVVLVVVMTTPVSRASELVPNWRSTSGPDGLTVSDVVDTTDGDVLIATENGIRRLGVGESTWQRSGLDGKNIWALGRSADGVFIAAGHFLFHRHLYRSSDDGHTWFLSEDGLPPAALRVYDLEAGPDGEILAAGDDGVYRFDSTAGRWRQYTDRFASYSVATDGAIVYAADTQYVRRSHDNGASWQRTFVGEDVWINAVAAGADGLVVAVAALLDQFPADDGVVFVSTDFGSSFRLADGEPGSGTEIGLSVSLDAEVLTNGAILVGGYQHVPGSIWGGVRASTDFGHSWSSTGNDRISVLRVEQLADGRVWAAGEENLMVDEGTGWTRTWTGLGGADVRSMASTPDGLFAGGSLTGVSVLPTSVSGWSYLGPDYVTIRSLAATPDGDLVASAVQLGAMIRMKGSGWTPLGRGDHWPALVAVDEAGTICVFDLVIGCTPDGGHSWVETDLESWYPTALTAVTEGVFVVADRYWGPNASRIHRSLDGGLSWERTLEGTGAIWDLTWDGRGALWSICETGEVAVSMDLGLTWSPRGFAGPGAPWTSLAVDRFGRLFAGSGDGLLTTSSDDGFSWRPFDSGLPSGAVKDLIVHHGLLAAAVEDNGVWSTPVSVPVRGGRPGRRVRPLVPGRCQALAPYPR